MCGQTPPPTTQTPNGHVRIEKTCKPRGEGLACRITVTNDGGVPLAGNISFADQGSWTDNGSPLVISSVAPSDPAIQCSGLPSNLVCTLPGSLLPPGASQSIDLTIAGGNGASTRTAPR